MKITFVLPNADMGGGIRVIAIYADLLTRRGHQVVVVSLPQKKEPLGAKLRSVLAGRGWPAHGREPSHLDGRTIDHRILDCWRAVTDKDVPDADVVVATWWQTAEWVACLSPQKGAKAYFLQHHEVFEGQPTERVEATWMLPFHKIVVAQWLVELGRTRYGDHDVSLVPNSVDHDQFQAPPRSKQPVPTMGLMYSTTTFKGCDVSLAAFDLASRRVPNLRLVSFGHGPPDARLPMPPGAAHTVQPPQAQLKDLYASCDAWLFGSRREGFGLPLLEAMACRTPVIATPVGAAPELVTHGGGRLVKPEDPEDMARAIIEICAMSQSEWQILSAAAYTTAMKHNWHQAADGFEAALVKAIDRTATGRFSSSAFESAPSRKVTDVSP